MLGFGKTSRVFSISPETAENGVGRRAAQGTRSTDRRRRLLPFPGRAQGALLTRPPGWPEGPGEGPVPG